MKLKTSFLALLEEQNAENNIQHEEKKLQILLVVKRKFQKEIPENNFFLHQNTLSVTQGSTVRQMLYWILVILGILQQATGSYLFATTLFSVIPSLPVAVSRMISVVYVILDLIIFYGFQVSFFKSALSLPQQSNHLGSLLKIYNEQLQVTIELNQSLSMLSVLKMDEKRYEHYVELIVLMNKDLRNKNNAMKDYPRSSFSKAWEYGIVAFGLLSTIANNYYMGIAYAAVIAPVVGTSLASIMIIITIISGLSLYYTLGITSIMHLASPNKKEFDALKIKLMAFSENYKNDLVDARVIKNEIYKSMQQTNSKLGLFKQAPPNDTWLSAYSSSKQYDTGNAYDKIGASMQYSNFEI